MSRTIVAVCDGHAKGRDAVALAATIADAQCAGLVLVAAYSDPLMPAPLELRDHSDLRRQAQDELARVRHELAPRARTVAVPALSAAHAVQRVADRERAEMIVVGTGRRPGRRRAAGPDRALDVLRGARCAVAVVPDGQAAPGRLGSVAVGFDGSRESWAALELATDLARAARARMRILLVVDDHMPGHAAAWAAVGGGVNWYGVVAERRRHAGALLEQAMAAAAGLAAGADVLVGDPARELAEADADLVVVGSRHHGPLRRLALGSTSEALIRTAKVPVLVAARGAVAERRHARARTDVSATT